MSLSIHAVDPSSSPRASPARRAPRAGATDDDSTSAHRGRTRRQFRCMARARAGDPILNPAPRARPKCISNCKVTFCWCARVRSNAVHFLISAHGGPGGGNGAPRFAFDGS